MAKQIQIFHPKPNEVVRGLHIAAQGIATGGVNAVKGVLIDNSSGHVIEGWDLFPAPKWVVLFRGLDAKRSYTLVVVELHTDGTFAVSPNVTISPVMALTMTWPPSTKASVSGANFAPYGTTTDNSTVVNSALGYPGGEGGPFTPSGMPSGGDWVIQFPALPTGTANLQVTQGTSAPLTAKNMSVTA
jgi:hypothetical protein